MRVSSYLPVFFFVVSVSLVAAQAPEKTTAPTPPADVIGVPNPLFQKCTVTADCTVANCTCETDSGRSVCANKGTVVANTVKCANCTSDAQCNGDTCNKDVFKCTKCVQDAALSGTKECAVCVSTAWLKERNLLHARLRDTGTSPVLCIPGNGNLPCGSPGHILRDSISGKLRTYREVCAERMDCVASTMEVSQLNHRLDWSVYKSHGLALTSLSAHPLSTPMSPSRVVACIADFFNRIGLSSVINAVAILPSRLPFEVISPLCA